MYKDPKRAEAYKRLKVIRQRCNRAAADNYKFYGAVGIKCLLPVHEFLEWFMRTKPSSEGIWTIGRLDHNKNYTMDNIEWQLQKYQTSERNIRVGLPKYDKRIKVLVEKEGKDFIFSSKKEAAEFLGVSLTEIVLMTQNKYKKEKSYSVRRI